MKTLLILSPFVLVALGVRVLVWWYDRRRHRAMKRAAECKHGVARGAYCHQCSVIRFEDWNDGYPICSHGTLKTEKCWQCVKEDADRKMDQIIKRERMDE